MEGNKVCDYKLDKNCEGVGKVPHKGIKSNEKGWPTNPPQYITKYACMKCEMAFDEE